MNSTCDICGFRGTEVRASVVAWKDLAQPYNAVDRCTDVLACRARVESQGEEWPVYDDEVERAGHVRPRVLGSDRSGPSPRKWLEDSPPSAYPPASGSLVRPDEVKG